eukprot:CAMPEP_0202690790 /NCGR_PEP_ID=MMETSP1385-20130828/5679_1 /ASSEMBLY_ACC=CAM_ASM_000861 /TAXON_ID=933848 /ORGANISM="Elphidium margaritaceum" /LENGTH=210 /DNA_ID=CAMNT_0049346091 /DNA_START=201 /DNA_END=833 /DNA_ORIENTATION=+
MAKKSVKFDAATTSKEMDTDDKDAMKAEKQKEDFNVSGALKRDLQTSKHGVALKYNEPVEGTVCTRKKWRIYEYKGDEHIDTYHIHRQSFYLFGRDQRIAHKVCLHPSISSQHAIIQYRRVPSKNSKKMRVEPYIMDLKSRHGTFLNGDRIESQRYYQLLPKDVIKFGVSTREYIVLASDSHAAQAKNDKQQTESAKEEENYNVWSDDEK